MEGLSNRDVPVVAGPLSVDVEYATGAPETLSVPVSAIGEATITPTRTDTVTRIVVRDRFGNVGEATF
jgi:hypothetical protein